MVAKLGCKGVKIGYIDGPQNRTYPVCKRYLV